MLPPSAPRDAPVDRSPTGRPAGRPSACWQAERSPDVSLAPFMVPIGDQAEAIARLHAERATVAIEPAVAKCEQAHRPLELRPFAALVGR